MDLSTGRRIDETRAAILAEATVPIGTVPIYQAVEGIKRIEDLTADLLLEVIEHQGFQGVDYMTVHAGVGLAHLPLCRHRVTASCPAAAGCWRAGWPSTGMRTPCSKRSTKCFYTLGPLVTDTHGLLTWR